MLENRGWRGWQCEVSPLLLNLDGRNSNLEILLGSSSTLKFFKNDFNKVTWLKRSGDIRSFEIILKLSWKWSIQWLPKIISVAFTKAIFNSLILHLILNTNTCHLFLWDKGQKFPLIVSIYLTNTQHFHFCAR